MRNSDRHSFRNRLVRYGPVAAVLTIAASLYLFQIGRRSLVIEEGYSLYDAMTLKGNGCMSQRPLYYVLLYFWMKLGASEAWLRGLSAIFALGSVLLTYVLGSKLFSRTHGLMAALFLALSPAFIHYGQMVRMYSLGTFLTLAGTVALSFFLSHSLSRWLALWILCRGLSFLATPLNATILAADIPILLWRYRAGTRPLVRTALGLGIGLVLCYPFIRAVFYWKRAFFLKWAAMIPSPTPALILDHLFWRPLISLAASQKEIDFTPHKMIFIAMMIGVFVSALFLRPRRREHAWVAAWTFVPPFILAVLSFTKGYLWCYRYQIFVLPYSLLLLSVGFLKLWAGKRLKFAAIILLAVYFAKLGPEVVYHYKARIKMAEDWRGVAGLIKANFRPRDRIIYMGNRKMAGALYYYVRRRKISVAGFAKGPGAAAAFENRVAMFPKHVRRVWIVCRIRRLKKPASIKTLAAVLKPRFPYQRIYSFPWMRVLVASRTEDALPPKPLSRRSA